MLAHMMTLLLTRKRANQLHYNLRLFHVLSILTTLHEWSFSFYLTNAYAIKTWASTFLITKRLLYGNENLEILSIIFNWSGFHTLRSAFHSFWSDTPAFWITSRPTWSGFHTFWSAFHLFWSGSPTFGITLRPSWSGFHTFWSTFHLFWSGSPAFWITSRPSWSGLVTCFISPHITL